MNKSESIAAISKALVTFQGKFISVKKESENPFFKNKYASLSAIIEKVQKPLSECGLAIVQLPSGTNCLETIMIHESGEYISETYEMKPSKNDPQGQGSAITYQRRYALGAILCLNIDEDDDGNRASQPEKKEYPRKESVNIPDHAKVRISEKQFSQLLTRLEEIAEPVGRGNFLAKVRNTFLPFTNEQENQLADLLDNL